LVSLKKIFFKNKNNLSHENFTNNNNRKINSAERQSTWQEFKWRMFENMPGKDVKAVSETNIFIGTCLPLLRIPFSAEHSMDIKKNTF